MALRPIRTLPIAVGWALVGAPMVGCGTGPGTGASGGGVLGTPDATLGVCPFMPADSFWHARVDRLATHLRSTTWVNMVGATRNFHMYFGSGTWDGASIGIPFDTDGAVFDTSTLSHDARVIAGAMKTYGIILADNGSSWYLSGAPDERRDNDSLHELDRISSAEVLVANSSALMVEADSGRVRT